MLNHAKPIDNMTSMVYNTGTTKRKRGINNMKYIINGTAYTCKTNEPHGVLRDMLIEAQINGWKVEKIEG